MRAQINSTTLAIILIILFIASLTFFYFVISGGLDGVLVSRFQ